MKPSAIHALSSPAESRSSSAAASRMPSGRAAACGPGPGTGTWELLDGADQELVAVLPGLRAFEHQRVEHWSGRCSNGAPEVTPPAGFGRIASAVTGRRVPVPASGAPIAHLKFTRQIPRAVILRVHGGGLTSKSPPTVRDYAILLAPASDTETRQTHAVAARVSRPVRYPIRSAVASPARSAVRRPGPDTAWPVNGSPARLIPDPFNRSGSDVSCLFRHVISGSLTLAFPVPT